MFGIDIGKLLSEGIRDAFFTVLDWIRDAVFLFVPGWVWIILIVLAAVWVWRKFGWQGLVALGIAILTFGAYRQGWRDARVGMKKPRFGIPVGEEPQWPEVTPEPPKRKKKRGGRKLVNGYWLEPGDPGYPPDD